jgi:aminoglycoside phosphotransferase family enzyme
VSAREPITTEAMSFLRRPDAYPEPTREVSVVETHMSWVFLADAHVYKLKKAVRHEGLDFTTPDLRRFNCFEEVRLNQEMAPGVYLGVVPLTRDADGRLSIGGQGIPVDWLVHMRRLPLDRNLEAIIRGGRTWTDQPAIREAARRLARFYRAATPASVTAAVQRARLEAGVGGDLEALSAPRYGLPLDRIEALVGAELAFLERRAALFEQRVLAGHIVEGHGDLRPEHVWIDGEPAIIDRLEFDPTLRVLDPADELAFLDLECERLGAPHVGGWFLEAYVQETGDEPPVPLLRFYRVYRALRRATISARHLDDPTVTDPDRFAARARRYLEMVEPVALDGGGEA